MTTPDIFIRRCTLRIVRREGWNWGPDPKGLVQGVIARICELLERKLPELWPEVEDLEIAAPVSIRVPVRLQELLGLASESIDDDISSTSTLNERFERAIDTAFAPFVAALVSSSVPLKQDEELAEAYTAVGQVSIDARHRSGDSIQRVLLLWHEQGLLESFLSTFSLQALEAWHRRLLEVSAEASMGLSSPTSEALIEQIWGIIGDVKDNLLVVQRELTDRSLDRPEQLRLRLRAVVEVAARFGVAPHDLAVVKALDQIFPLDDQNGDGDRESATSVPTVTQFPAASTRLWQGEFSVSSALPFILLGPLSRIGYLQVLNACLEAAEMLPAASLFAQALAYKVLASPERGWRRRPADVTTATIFAGRFDPFGTTELVDFARKVSPYLSPLDTVLKESLITGHNPCKPLFFQRLDAAGGDGLLLVDVEGIFPIAWAADLESLIPTLGRFGQTPLLVPRASIEVAPLNRLNDAGFYFITDAPPNCYETWRALQQSPDHHYWTNDRASSESSLITLASPLAEVAEEADMLWRALAVQRSSVPLASDQRLDRSLTLAAAAALGTIAWILWRKREPVAPYLALDRFYDLDARVSADLDTVCVRLPIGRRYQDLYEHGFLLDVPDVPWLGGRILQFSGG